MAKLEILSPVAHSAVSKSSLAPRPTTLDNKRIALYWNGKGGGDIALARIGELLDNRFKGLKLELIRSAIPGPKEKLERAKSFDAVICATAD